MVARLMGDRHDLLCPYCPHFECIEGLHYAIQSETNTSADFCVGDSSTFHEAFDPAAFDAQDRGEFILGKKASIFGCVVHKKLAKLCPSSFHAERPSRSNTTPKNSNKIAMAVVSRVKTRTVNPLAYAFAGSNPALPTSSGSHVICDRRRLARQ
jgi:hypothetical protein